MIQESQYQTDAGATLAQLSRLTGLNSSTISRRHDAAITRSNHDPSHRKRTDQVMETYKASRIATSQA